jgi:putative ABC transport system substrate-binding protein
VVSIRDFPKVEMVLTYPRLIGRDGCDGASSSQHLAARRGGRWWRGVRTRNAGALDILVRPAAKPALLCSMRSSEKCKTWVICREKIYISIEEALRGGNITGMSSQSVKLTAKALELLHVAVPNAERIAVLTPPAPQHKLMLKDASAAAESLGVQIIPVMARTPDDFDQAFATMHTENCQAVLVLADPRIVRKLVELSDQWRLPTIYQATGFVDMGGMLSYSANTTELFRGAATYVDKILGGAKPADLPVEQPTRFELQVNLKTARALGITLTASSPRADEVIE